MGESILTPILVLVCWTLIMWLWMYATRLPAMTAANVDPQDAMHPGSLSTLLPSKVQRIADNYNHLHEAPTIFYALAVYTHLANMADPLNITLAWTYVGLRIAHSLVQSTANIVMARFGLFALSTLVLIVIAVRDVLAIL